MVDPLSIGLAIGGIGLQILGGFGASENAKKQSEISKAIAGDEMRINEQKRQQMELEAKRSLLQNMRNAQRLRAQAAAAAVNQGASKGSGLYGGLAGITDQEGVNALGVDQNLEIGRNIFSINDSISAHKMQLSQLQGEQATNQSLMSLGGSLVNNAGTIGNFFGFGKGGSGNITLGGPNGPTPFY